MIGKLPTAVSIPGGIACGTPGCEDGMPVDVVIIPPVDPIDCCMVLAGFTAGLIAGILVPEILSTQLTSGMALSIITIVTLLKKGHSSYKATFQIHYHMKILLNCLSQEKPPFL